MSLKLNFGSEKLFLELNFGCTWLSLKCNDGYGLGLELIFWLISNFRSGLKLIFHCNARSVIFERLWFRLTVLVVISCTVENKEVLSPKSF